MATAGAFAVHDPGSRSGAASDKLIWENPDNLPIPI